MLIICSRFYSSLSKQEQNPWKVSTDYILFLTSISCFTLNINAPVNWFCGPEVISLILSANNTQLNWFSQYCPQGCFFPWTDFFCYKAKPSVTLDGKHPETFLTLFSFVTLSAYYYEDKPDLLALSFFYFLHYAQKRESLRTEPAINNTFYLAHSQKKWI